MNAYHLKIHSVFEDLNNTMKNLMVLTLFVACLHYVVCFPNRFSYEIRVELEDPNAGAKYFHYGKINLGLVEKSGEKSTYTLSDE